MKHGVLRIFKPEFDTLPQVGKLAVNKDWVYNIPQTQEDCQKSAEWFGNKLAFVIITEQNDSSNKIKVDDNCFDIENKKFLTATHAKIRNLIERAPDNYERILLDLHDITASILQQIVDKELYNGDYVSVEEITTFVITPEKI